MTGDQAFVKSGHAGSARGFLDSIPALRNREVICCGEGVAYSIRVALDTDGGGTPSGLGRSDILRSVARTLAGED